MPEATTTITIPTGNKSIERPRGTAPAKDLQDELLMVGAIDLAKLAKSRGIEASCSRTIGSRPGR